MISFLVLLAIVVCFSAILALALNFQWGLGGMVNFGLAGFYTLGAYSCALLILEGGANTLAAPMASPPRSRPTMKTPAEKTGS